MQADYRGLLTILCAFNTACSGLWPSGLLWGASYGGLATVLCRGDARPEGGITVLLSGRMGAPNTCLLPESCVPSSYPRLSLGPSSGP